MHLESESHTMRDRCRSRYPTVALWIGYLIPIDNTLQFHQGFNDRGMNLLIIKVVLNE